jgi:predicted rRNA methylase YqxC with S4 and FtsJ domains
MNVATYAIEAKVEQTHWWFVGRRKLFASEIERLGLPQDAPILDVGTSTGTHLRMLTEQGYHNVCGLDFQRGIDQVVRSKRVAAGAQGGRSSPSVWRQQL